jgi:sulfhydrogenase subunit alpha
MDRSPSRTIIIPHLGRVEGHGGIFVKVVDDRVVEVNLDIHEGSRFYEKLLVGKNYLEVQGIITRVCAICSADHTVAALMALENAVGITETEHVRRLRGLLLLGAAIESHALHVFALALPDYLGFESVIAMAERYPEEVTSALKLKQLGNRVQELIGGRPVHPINTIVGGFGRLPSHRQLAELRAELARAVDSAMRFVDLAGTLEVPAWSANTTIFMVLRPDDPAYRFRGTAICTSRGEEYPVASYREVVREYTVEHSHAKHAALASGESYMVGALARLWLLADRLRGRAREAFERLFPGGVQPNILLNNWAQLVEIVHCLERGATLCDELLDLPEADCEVADYEVRAGRGIAAVEVPRGILFHEYEIDDDGRVVAANIVTPTAQNLANVERDLRAAAECLLPTGPPGGDAELRRDLEMVTRAYDPCISCSVHVVRVNS